MSAPPTAVMPRRMQSQRSTVSHDHSHSPHFAAWLERRWGAGIGIGLVMCFLGCGALERVSEESAGEVSLDAAVTLDGATDGDGDSDGGASCASAVTFATVQAGALGPCGGETCHKRAPFAAGLDLTSASAYAQLVGKPSTFAPGLARVKPGDPDASFLWLKLIDHLPVNGSQGRGMPWLFNRWQELPADQLAQVRCWIAQGARP